MAQTNDSDCPVCGSGEHEVFHRVTAAPVHLVRLLRSREEALQFPTGTIELAFCRSCGFIWNRAFDRSLLDYGIDYEETQGYSPTFREFHHDLAQRLIGRYGLAGKHVVEVGCGKGEFLSLLCELGVGHGTGIDPAYVAERNTSSARDRVRGIPEYLSAAHRGIEGDLVCCKMTLEHIDRPAEFLALIGETLCARSRPVLFFQVPEARHILQEGAFWDVYYEHCSYFTPGSLARLFRRAGYEIIDLWTGYDDQYLMIEARSGAEGAAEEEAEPLEESLAQVRSFGARCRRLTDAWADFVAAEAAAGRPTVLWGGGSKAVAFVTSLRDASEIRFAVDINPHKHGCYLPGGGQEVIGPERLVEVAPRSVIAMNPVYVPEIGARLAELGLSPALHTVDRPPAAGGQP